MGKAAKSGTEVYAKSLGDWYPIVGIEFDCELIKIDVCNMIDILHLYDCDIRIGQTEIVDDVYLETKGIQQC